MSRLVALSSVLAGTAALAAAPLEAPALSDDEAKRLEEGEVLVRSLEPTDGKGMAAMAIGLVDGAPAEVWPVVRDCQHYQAFMPRTKRSEVKEEAGVMLCRVELSLPFPLKDLWSESKSVLTEEPPRFRREWTLVRGTYHRNQGSWTLLPWADGGKTLVVYVVDAHPDSLVPEALSRAAQAKSLPEMFAAVRQRLLRQRGGAAASP
jgi:ribosome-associated toxin RatA of RatAB toxin-antitoxin module